MKFDDRHVPDYDATDLAILDLLQENCKQPLASIGTKVGLKAPSVVERIHKMEEAGIITGYVALLDGRRIGMDVTAYLGVWSDRPDASDRLGRAVGAIEEVQECHHVTGGFTLLLKVKTRNTESLERLIEQVRSLDGVNRTETMVVLSTAAERPRVALSELEGSATRPPRRSGGARERRSPK
jgi:Lrp/AsnC family leucine-responsive transcriptional regulator